MFNAEYAEIAEKTIVCHTLNLVGVRDDLGDEIGLVRSTALISITTESSTTRSRRYPAIKLLILINHRQRFLLFYFDTHVSKLERQAGCVGRFKQSRPKALMYFDCRADNFAGNRIESVFLIHSSAFSATSAVKGLYG